MGKPYILHFLDENLQTRTRFSASAKFRGKLPASPLLLAMIPLHTHRSESDIRRCCLCRCRVFEDKLPSPSTQAAPCIDAFSHSHLSTLHTDHTRRHTDRVHTYKDPGMWFRLRRLGLKTVSRCTNVSSRSHLGQNPQRLGAIYLGLCPAGLVSDLGPLRLVETFRAGARRACCSCS